MMINDARIGKVLKMKQGNNNDVWGYGQKSIQLCFVGSKPVVMSYKVTFCDVEVTVGTEIR